MQTVFFTQKKKMLQEISKIFNFSQEEFEGLISIFNSKKLKENLNIDNNYKILGISKSAGIEEVQKRYKELIKKYHPDKLQGMGLPKEFIDLANEKLTAINKAYNEIKNDKRNI